KNVLHVVPPSMNRYSLAFLAPLDPLRTHFRMPRRHNSTSQRQAVACPVPINFPAVRQSRKKGDSPAQRCRTAETWTNALSLGSKNLDATGGGGDAATSPITSAKNSDSAAVQHSKGAENTESAFLVRGVMSS